MQAFHFAAIAARRRLRALVRLDYHERGTVNCTTRVPHLFATSVPPPPPPPTRGWRSGGNEGVTFGLGARYAITPTSAFRAEWQRYNRLGASDGPSVNVDLVSLGVLIRF